MNTIKGGTEATKGGFHWNTKTWAIVLAKHDGDHLPGDADDVYVRIPTFALVVLGPMIGGLFAMFLPFIGFALVAYYGAKKIATLTANAARSLAATVAPAWHPGHAYLAGKPGEKKAEETKAEDDSLKALEEEIDERRRG